jgi:hypothetical protein
MENSNIDLHKHCQLIFDKDTKSVQQKAIQEEKTFQQSAGASGHP